MMAKIHIFILFTCIISEFNIYLTLKSPFHPKTFITLAIFAVITSLYHDIAKDFQIAA